MENRGGLKTSTKYKIKSMNKDYWSIPNKEWCDLVSTLESKEKSKRYVFIIRKNN